MAIKKHQQSKLHIEAMEVMVTIPKTVPDVSTLLSKACRDEMVHSRNMLTIILSSVRYLARQGLALRKSDDSESNLIQLLQLRAEDNSQITNWLTKGR